MPDLAFHRQRREALLERVDRPVLLFAGGWRARNYPANVLAYRADSNFLYLFDRPEPDAAALLDPADGSVRLFLHARTADDALWHGVQPSLEQERERQGVTEVLPLESLRSTLQSVAGTRSIASVATPDERTNVLARDLTGLELDFFNEEKLGDPALIDALADLRMAKTDSEIEILRHTAAITKLGHENAMRATKAGGTEQMLCGVVDGTFWQHGCTPAYPTILSVRGEVLHNYEHRNPLRSGDLVLLDAGAEAESGHCSDVTRTWPVDGKFTPEQAEIYDIVLAAQLAGIAVAQPGVRFRDVHMESCRILTDGLVQMGLLKGSVDSLVEAGTHALFFPHGLGHMIGLDVHDMEGFGDRIHYPGERQRSTAFGTAFLRMDRDINEHAVLTIEPGIYFADTILHDDKVAGPHRDSLDMPRIEAFLKMNDGRGFGGVRLEDDVLCTSDGPVVLTGDIAKDRCDVEALIGQGL